MRQLITSSLSLIVLTILPFVSVEAITASKLLSKKILSTPDNSVIRKQLPLDTTLQTMMRITEIKILPEYLMIREKNTEIDLSYWNSTDLNPYRGVSHPSYLEIDCSNWVLPTYGYICSDYGSRRGRLHSGTDLKLNLGDTVVASFDGKVRFAKNYMGYGKLVIIRHPNGLETLYSHLSHIGVMPGQIVRAGEYIGLGGRTGRATTTHLHFEVRLMGKTINPSDIFDFGNKTLRSDTYVYSTRRKQSASSSKAESNRGLSASSSDVHVVRQGETLSVVARKYGISLNDLYKLNNLTSTSVLRLGQKIVLRDAATAVAVPKPLAVSQSETVNETTKEKTLTTSAPATKQIHVVKSGDTLGSIAKRYGVTIEHLCELNGITRQTTLRLGQKIRFT